MSDDTPEIHQGWLTSLHHRYTQVSDTVWGALDTIPDATINKIPFLSWLDRVLTAGLSNASLRNNTNDGSGDGGGSGGTSGRGGGGGGPRPLSASELRHVRLVSTLSLVLVLSQGYRAVCLVRKQWRRSSRRQGLFAWTTLLPSHTKATEKDNEDVLPVDEASHVRLSESPMPADAPASAAAAPPVDKNDDEEPSLLMAEVLNRYWRQVRRAILLAPRSPSPLQPFPEVLPYSPPRTHRQGAVLLRPRARHHRRRSPHGEGEAADGEGDGADDEDTPTDSTPTSAGPRCAVCQSCVVVTETSETPPPPTTNTETNAKTGPGAKSPPSRSGGGGGGGQERASKTFEPIFSLPIEGAFIYTHRPDELGLSPDRLFFQDPLGGQLARGLGHRLKSSAVSMADLSELGADRPGKHEATGRFSQNPDDPRTFWEALFVSWVGSVQYPVSFREMRKLLLSTAPSAFLSFVNTDTTYGPTVKDISCANMALLWYMECLRRIHQSLVVHHDIERCEDEVEELRKYAPVLYRLCIARWPMPPEMKRISERVLSTYNISVMCSPQGAWQTLDCARVELLALRRRMNYESLFSLGRYLYASSGSKRVSTALIAMLTALSTQVHSVGRLVRERLNYSINNATSPEKQMHHQQQHQQQQEGADGSSSSSSSSSAATSAVLWTLVAFELARVMLKYTIAQTSSEFIALTAARRHEVVRAQLLEAFAHMPLTYFEQHSADDIESILYYVDDMEGLDVQLNQFAFNTINALMAVGESLLLLNGRALVVVGLSVLFPRVLKRVAKRVESRYRNLEQIGALPWLVIQSDSDADDAPLEEPPVVAAAVAGDEETTTTTTTAADGPSTVEGARPSGVPRSRAALHTQQPGMLLWGTPLPPLRRRGGSGGANAAAVAALDEDDEDFAREGFMLRGEEIIYSLAHLRPYGADTRLVHWWNRYTELQNRARTPGGGGGGGGSGRATSSSSTLAGSRNTWQFFRETMHELLWLPYGKVIPGLGAAVLEMVDWLAPILITNYGVVWSGLAVHLNGESASLPVDFASALFALSDAVDAVDSAADVLVEGVDMVSVVLANAYKASVLEKLLSPHGWERSSHQEARHLVNTPSPPLPHITGAEAGAVRTGAVDLLDARLYRAYTISEIRFQQLQCRYTDVMSGGAIITTTAPTTPGAADAACGIFKQPLNVSLHLYPGPSMIRCPTTGLSSPCGTSGSVTRGCFVCITGPNGTGKSTLANVLLGLTQGAFAASSSSSSDHHSVPSAMFPVVLSLVRQAPCCTEPPASPAPPQQHQQDQPAPPLSQGFSASRGSLSGGLRVENQVLNPSFLDLAAMERRGHNRSAAVSAEASVDQMATMPASPPPSTTATTAGPTRPARFDVPLGCVPADVLRRRLFSYVPATPILFNGATVAHNISLAGYVSLASEEVLTRARICATAARCAFIDQLPLGLLTKVTDGSAGTSGASGASSGDGLVRLTPEQLQLLMIARALYHGGDVLLMDEPTRQAEPATVRALRDLWREMLATGIVKGIICFTTEPCLLEMADQVVTLEGDAEEEEEGEAEKVVASPLNEDDSGADEL